jgi:tRNA-dihydrouridine synthase
VVPDRPDVHQVKETILEQARMMVEFKGEYTGIHEMRKHVAWYSVGMYDSSKLRNLVNQVDTYKELEELLNKWEDEFT